MRHVSTMVMTAGLLTLVYLGISVQPTWAKESYKDEAGRILYTVDDDGIVSMFENSPTDLTISVTRGTREKMQPRITEVAPEAIPAGSSMLLRLKGENLIGATVKLSVPGIEVGAYVGKPKSLDLPLRLPSNVPSGEVTIEVATPIGATRALFQVKELQIGGTGPKKREGGAVLKLEATAPTSCPAGMGGVGAERGGFCIELDGTFSGGLRKAEITCAIVGVLLCCAVAWRMRCTDARLSSLEGLAGPLLAPPTLSVL